MAIERRNAEIILLYTTAYPFRLPDRTMLCVYCSTSFNYAPEFRLHMQEDHRNFNVDTAFAHCRYDGYVKADCTDLQCRICSLPFEKLETIAIHIHETHDKKINLSYDLGIHPFRMEGDKMNCYFCEKNFAGIRQLSRHLASHYSKYTCETCGKCYFAKSSLKAHITFGHRGDSHICRKCKCKFKSTDDYKQHITDSKKCWSHVCNTCGERFRGWHLKEQHMEQVHGRPTQSYPCPECHQVFSSRKYMRTHFKFTHTDETVVCTFCGNKFDTKRALDEHLLVHTQMKLFTCSVCAKSFARKKNLEQHMWIHIEKKRFGCVPCNKKFNQRVSWRTHMKVHHPEEGVS